MFTRHQLSLCQKPLWAVSSLILFWTPLAKAVATPVENQRYHISMGGVYRMETSTSAQVTDPYLGLSLGLGRRWTEFDFNIEYQEIQRKEAGNPTLSVGSRDREIFGFLDRRIDAISSESFRTGLGIGGGVLLSSARTRFQNVLTEPTGQSELLMKAGLSVQYVLGGFQMGADFRLHYSRASSDNMMSEILVRLGSRF